METFKKIFSVFGFIIFLLFIAYSVVYKTFDVLIEQEIKQKGIIVQAKIVEIYCERKSYIKVRYNHQIYQVSSPKSCKDLSIEQDIKMRYYSKYPKKILFPESPNTNAYISMYIPLFFALLAISFSIFFVYDRIRVLKKGFPKLNRNLEESNKKYKQLIDKYEENN
ncbi:MAG: hypothetical protein EAZ85_13090 [Bacteroidetes bacterium]|nr:MAG: hypothetical protein EAZ85_13090 [Bacteroidota bacterium]TAG86453.1 MAG: hypothetical protein EAZ20_12715 [Bacteroidota bacterium]